jgi:hypothetical protein
MKGSTTTAMSRGAPTWRWKFKRLGEVVQGFGTKMPVAVALSGTVPMRRPAVFCRFANFLIISRQMNWL